MRFGKRPSAPESSQSDIDICALIDVSAAATPCGASALVVVIFEPEPMCMQITTRVSSHAANSGSHQWSARWIDGSPRLVGQLGERDRGHAACGDAPHFGGGEHGVPERHEPERDEPAAAVAAPFVDHPVVVRGDALQREVLVLGLEEQLPGEARDEREAQRSLGAVDVHVGDARRGVVAPGAHLRVRDRREREALGREARARDHLRDRAQHVFVDPPVDDRAVAALDVLRALLVGRDDRLARVLHRTRADFAILGGEAIGPHARRLDDVVVHRDHPRQFAHAPSVTGLPASVTRAPPPEEVSVEWAMDTSTDTCSVGKSQEPVSAPTRSSYSGCSSMNSATYGQRGITR